MAESTDGEGANSAAARNEEAGLTREEYFAERQLLIEARQRGYQRAEQMVAGGAAGGLLLSITFLEKIAPAATVTNPGFLVSAWSVLLACLSCALLGQYASARAFGCEIARLEASIHAETPPENRWGTLSCVLGVVSAVLLVIGIVLLACFAYVNAPFNRGGL